MAEGCATTATILDGKALARRLRGALADRVAALAAEGKRPPGLATVLVGTDPASQVYVRSKMRATVSTGMRSFEHVLPADTTQRDLLALVHSLNRNDAVDGILVQLPLPQHIEPAIVLNAVDPAKDVDGFHPINVGRLATGQPALVPCTPRGCMHLLASIGVPLAGLHAVVVGRSNIVGKPMAQLLLRESCTITIAHSRTRDLPAVCRLGDIVVAAAGRPRMLGPTHIRPGAVVIDVGVNRVATPGGKDKLVGDVDFDAVAPIARAITPVPGGVGPMTIACLLENTLDAYLAHTG